MLLRIRAQQNLSFRPDGGRAASSRFSHTDELNGAKSIRLPDSFDVTRDSEFQDTEMIKLSAKEKIFDWFAVNGHFLRKLLQLVVFYVVGVVFYSKIEGWTVLNCVYFITQTVSTVGYGNISPATVTGRVFTFFYIFVGIFLIFSVINEITYVLFVESIKAKRKVKRRSKISIIVRKVIQVSFWFMFLFALTIIAAFVFIKNEGWSFTTAFYFAGYTSSGVGYGDMALSKQSSIIFNIFFIFFSCSVTALAMEKASTASMRIQEAELIQEIDELTLTDEMLDAIKSLTHTDKIRRSDYILYMLLLSGTIDQSRDVEPWIQRFKEFDFNRDGKLDRDDVVRVAKFNATMPKKDIKSSHSAWEVLVEIGITLMEMLHLRKEVTDPHKSMNLRIDAANAIKMSPRKRGSAFSEVQSSKQQTSVDRSSQRPVNAEFTGDDTDETKWDDDNFSDATERGERVHKDTRSLAVRWPAQTERICKDASPIIIEKGYRSNGSGTGRSPTPTERGYRDAGANRQRSPSMVEKSHRDAGPSPMRTPPDAVYKRSGAGTKGRIGTKKSPKNAVDEFEFILDPEIRKDLQAYSSGGRDRSKARSQSPAGRKVAKHPSAEEVAEEILQSVKTTILKRIRN